MHRIDSILAKGNYQEELSGLKAEVDKINAFPVSEKRELELPVGRIKLKPWRSLWAWATERRERSHCQPSRQGDDGDHPSRRPT